jgi:hypothetical protein
MVFNIKEKTLSLDFLPKTQNIYNPLKWKGQTILGGKMFSKVNILVKVMNLKSN